MKLSVKAALPLTALLSFYSITVVSAPTAIPTLSSSSSEVEKALLPRVKPEKIHIDVTDDEENQSWYVELLIREDSTIPRDWCDTLIHRIELAWSTQRNSISCEPYNLGTVYGELLLSVSVPKDKRNMKNLSEEQDLRWMVAADEEAWKDWVQTRLAGPPKCCICKQTECSEAHTTDDAEPCVICSEEDQVGLWAKMKNCKPTHMFHRVCAEDWVNANRKCPLCQTSGSFDNTTGE